MSLANTQSLDTNLNADPYYDDFSEGKNFHRILFRPGQAVQARELTQMQTIQQNQLDRFAEHIFSEGSVVRGGEMNYDRVLPYIKLRDSSAGLAVNTAVFIGKTITGGTTGVTAYVVDALTGSEAATPNTKTLYIRYTGSGSLGTTATFSSGEVLTSSGGHTANVATEGVQTTNVAGTGSRISFGAGVLYAKDNFIRFDAANTIVGRYSANVDYRIGYNIVESIVTSTVDSTLLDPARGAYNYIAPGADRLKLVATIDKKLLTDTATTNFIERTRLKDGNIEFKTDKPVYSVINDYIARRTYDESGDYIVNGLTSRIREHLDSANNGGVYTLANGGDVNKLVVDVAPGKAYVRGYEIENLTTNHVTIDKATDVNSITQISIPANYGNYTPVDELVGTWDINGHDRVSLYSTAQNAISSGQLSSGSPTGVKIGEARVRALEYSSGTKAAATGQYNMYLYDINMTANSFSYVRSIYFDDASHDGFADTVLTANSAILNETAFNRSLFNIPAENIKRLRDTSGVIDNEFRFKKEFSVTIAADGTVTATTGLTDEQFPFSVGALNDTQERENFLVVLEATANSATARDTTAAKATGANTITGLTSATTKYNVGDVLKLQGIANTFIVSSILGATSVSVYGLGTSTGTTSGATVFKAFQPGQVISLNGYGGDGTARSVTINSTTSATIDIQETLAATVAASIVTELKKVDGQEIAKNLQSSRYVEINVSVSGTTAGPWNLGVSDGFNLQEVRVKTGNAVFTTTSQGTDITNQFDFDTGMRDNFYDHAKLKLKHNATHAVANGNVYLVKFDYFTHNTSSGVGYFSIDSYPIDDANTANTTAIATGEVPIYTSLTSGIRYDLRNHIDIRPRIVDTANNVTTLTNMSRTPATSTTIAEPSGGLRFMAPNEDFITDLDYYLPRKDRIVVTADGKFRAVKGTPDLLPKIPPGPSDGMTIAIVNVKPYPSLPQENANRISTGTAPNGRTDLSIKIEPVRIRRFTMKDIKGLESRIDNLEYYTSLSLLESDTKNLFLSSTSGIDRFKNGIVVDQFVDFSVSDFYNDGYRVAIDKQEKELRPSFKLDDVQLEFQSANSSNITATSKDTSLTISSSSAAYANGETITQGAASGTLDYQVGTKLYISGVSGTFSTSANAVGGTSTATSAVSAASAVAAGKLILLPWTHDMTVEQPFATDTRNAAGLQYSFIGTATLNPTTDYWQDITTSPSVQIEFGQFAEALQEIANFVGVQWNGWQNTGRITSTNSGFIFDEPSGSGTVLGQVEQMRTGQRLNVNAGELLETNLGDSVQNINIIPFIRSRNINVTGQGLKPNTRVYVFFDGVSVSNYISPANSSFANTSAEGSALLTNSSGVAYANFRIPNEDALKFTVGDKVFRFTDSVTDSSTIGAATTGAQTTYSAQGLDVTTRGTIISTRSIDISISQVAPQTSTITQRVDISTIPRIDPIAQTFRVSDGINSTIPGAYLSKLDLYFSAKDSAQPVVIEIRECDPATAFITSRIVPFGKVIVTAANINTSTTGTSPTPIIFETPVYLMNNVDYAIVIKPADGNPNVSVWTARLGENDLITGNRVTEQPAAGILFASANDRTWTAIQEEDLKFKLYFANFGNNQTGTAVFKNTDKEYLTLANTDNATVFKTVHEVVNGETTLVLSGAITANVGDIVVQANTTSAQANGIVTYNSGSTIRVKEVTLDTKFTDSASIYKYAAASGANTGTTATISSQATPAGRVYFFDAVTQSNTIVHLSVPTGSFTANTWLRGQTTGLDARIVSVDNLRIDTFKPFMSKLELQDTTTAVTAKFATSASARDTAFRRVSINDNNQYDARRYILSRSNEVLNLSSSKSAELIATLTNASNKRHSPAIDNDRAAIFTIENLINNDSTNENTTTEGSALARYIQRTVTLAEGQDAEDLKVFITAYKPSTATISIYVKLLNNDDGDQMDDKTWLNMTQVTAATIVSDSENTNDFKEYEYQIPTASLTGASGEVQYDASGVTYTGFKRFKIKIVLLSSTPSRVPRVKDFRAIALQI